MSRIEKMIDSLFPTIAIRDCVRGLDEDINITSVESTCGNILLDDGREAQVRIIITTDIEDFIEPFDIIATKSISCYNKDLELKAKNS